MVQRPAGRGDDIEVEPIFVVGLRVNSPFADRITRSVWAATSCLTDPDCSGDFYRGGICRGLTSVLGTLKVRKLFANRGKADHRCAPASVMAKMLPVKLTSAN